MFLREKSCVVHQVRAPVLALTWRVAHLSFFERWDSTSLSRLGFMDSADASQVLYSAETGEDEKEAQPRMSPRLPTFAEVGRQPGAFLLLLWHFLTDYDHLSGL